MDTNSKAALLELIDNYAQARYDKRIDDAGIDPDIAEALNNLGAQLEDKRQTRESLNERLLRISEAALRLTLGDHSHVLPISNQGDEVDAISMAVNTLSEELQATGRVINDFEMRINQILEILLRYTSLDFEETVPISESGDELDAIAMGLNTMSEELQTYIKALNDAQEELRQINGTLEIKVKERTEELAVANQTLHDSNEALRKTNEDLDAFIYATSHDLKVPITNMEGLLTMLGAMMPTDNPVLPGILEKMKEASEKVKKTIRNLETAAQTQKAIYDDYEEIHFENILGDIRSDLNDLIDQTGAVIETDFDANAINYSRDGMNSILNNLLSNAIKYHKPESNPEVKIATHKEDDFLVLSIQDNGLGIDLDKHRQKVFAIFKRLHDHVEGDGVGLNLIKRIIENHEGKIEVESELGQGSTFKVYFKTDEQKA